MIPDLNNLNNLHVSVSYNIEFKNKNKIDNTDEFQVFFFKLPNVNSNPFQSLEHTCPTIDKLREKIKDRQKNRKKGS